VKLPSAFSDSIVRAIALNASTILNREAMNYHWETALAAVGVGIVYIVSSTAVGDDQTPLVKLLSDPTEQQHVIGVAGRSTVILQNPCATAQ
jgi:hypothetical protein